jgi:hypothetical protein
MTGSDDEEVIQAWMDETLGTKRRQKNTYLWVDRNDDHIPQADEITLGKLGNVYHGPGPGASIGPDLCVVAGGGAYNPRRGEDGETKFYTSIMRYCPENWSEGVPQYSLPDDASDLDVAPMYVQPDTDAYIGRAAVRHTYQSNDGALYAFYNWGARGMGSFPTFQAGRYARLTKWNANGTRQWSVGRKANGSNKAAIHWRPTDSGAFHYPAEIAGKVRGTIVVCDRIVNPGMAWTTDGLFAGSFFPGRVDDGLPGWVYAWQRDMETNRKSLITHDCLEGGAITEHDGDVYFLSPGSNSIVVYRVHGYDRDEWMRITETVHIDQEYEHASETGSGLRAEFYEGTEITGTPDATVQDVHPNDLTIPEDMNTDNGIAVRLTGEIEAPLDESFTFGVSGGALRMWVDGEQVVECWNEDDRYTPGASADPIELSAGRRVPIQIDMATTNTGRFSDDEKTSVGFWWKSMNTDPDDVPLRFLYPVVIDTVDSVEPRPATSRIHARSHDHTISSDGILFDSFHCRHHMTKLKGKYLGYRRIDFGDGVETFIINLRKGNATEITVELRLDGPDGPLLDTVTLPELSIEYRLEKTLELDVAGQDIDGVHDLYIITTAGRHGPRMRWFQFGAVPQTVYHDVILHPGAHGSLAEANSGDDYAETLEHGTAFPPITVDPDTGYAFTGWEPPLPDTVTADVEATAQYAPLTYTLTYTAGANGAIEGPTPQTVEHGADGAEVTATPAEGYHFVAWSDGIVTAARADTGITADLAVTAEFAINTYTVTFDPGRYGTRTGGGELEQTLAHGDAAVPPRHHAGPWICFHGLGHGVRQRDIGPLRRSD